MEFRNGERMSEMSEKSFVEYLAKLKNASSGTSFAICADFLIGIKNQRP